MKPWKELLKTKKFWIMTLVVIFLVVGIPVIINELYKANKGYITVWNGEDVLSYYGTLLGAMATVWVLDRTIKFTIVQYQRDRFIQNEEVRWQHIEKLSITLLDYIQPVKLNEMFTTILPKLPQKYLDPDFVIFTTHAQILFNAILSSINDKDKEKIDPFLKIADEMITSTCILADELHSTLSKVNEILLKYDGKRRDLYLKKYTAQTPQILRKGKLLQEGAYNLLLQQKRDCFAKIYEQIEKDAMQLT